MMTRVRGTKIGSCKFVWCCHNNNSYLIANIRTKSKRTMWRPCHGEGGVQGYTGSAQFCHANHYSTFQSLQSPVSTLCRTWTATAFTNLDPRHPHFLNLEDNSESESDPLWESFVQPPLSIRPYSDLITLVRIFNKFTWLLLLLTSENALVALKPFSQIYWMQSNPTTTADGSKELMKNIAYASHS